MNFKQLNNITGWLAFSIAAIVYILTAEPTGSLWDCGEFISAAYKMEVVHPPGAPLFLMIGRLFTWVADMVSADKATIAYALNVMSGLCTAALVMFIFWSTTILAKLSLVGYHEKVTEKDDMLAILGSGFVAALSTTFATSVWFSAVEGEVYAMSSGFTGLVIWAALRWYVTVSPKADRWLVFIAYMIGLSIGVHLLSLLAIPFIALLFYFKKRRVATMEFSPNMMYVVLGFALLVGVQFVSVLPVWLHVLFGLGIPGLYAYAAFASPAPERKVWLNIGLSFVIGFAILMFIQAIFIPKLPQVAAGFDFVFVNNLGLGVGTGMFFFVVLLLATVVAGLYYAQLKSNYNLQMGMMMFAMALMGFSTYASIIIRANANTPINMNNPSDPYSLVSYINREQYGERPLAFGPHFMAKPIGTKDKGKVYRPVEKNGKVIYDVVGDKFDYEYSRSDMMPFPRLGHMDRGAQYRRWLSLEEEAIPTMNDNLDFFFRYQIGWMYFRYFMWNFSGRQNAKQGFYSNDPTKGNWQSGIGLLDSGRLIPTKDLPESMTDQGNNNYYFLPLIFGLIGLIFHISRRPQEALAMGILFLITGVAIILFSNQPPNEPRERDYVLVGSMFTFCIWIGLAVAALYKTFKDVLKNGMGAGALAIGLVIIAPLIMGFQNWDDHSRARHTGARDYANNFLQSCAPNAVVFTYGDNDTYPLWYAQEVEGIRLDVRVVNFSLLAVDWYIDQLRRKMNESDAIPMTISRDAYRGSPRNALPIQDSKRLMNLLDVVKYMGESHPIQNSVSLVPTADVYLPVDKAAVRKNGAVPTTIPDSLIEDKVSFRLPGRYLQKDDIALMDILATNAANGWVRPIYFAVTVRAEKIGELKNYLQMEGMALRIVPIKTPSSGGFAGAMMMGRVEVDTMYRNMMERFRWGGFDQYKMFVDESYAPSIQTQQFAFMRLANELRAKGDKERAINALDRLYVAFPNFNFPIDEGYSRIQGLDLYIDLGAEDKAKPHLEDLVKGVSEKLAYFSQFISPATPYSFEAGMQQTDREYNAMIQQYNQLVGQMDALKAQGQQAPQNLMQQLIQLKGQIDQLDERKETFFAQCANPDMAAVFQGEISAAIQTASMAMRMMVKMKDTEFKKRMEEMLTPYGLPSSEPKTPTIPTENVPTDTTPEG